MIYAAIVFVIGYLLYYTGKIGGGDLKLFIGITLVLPELAGVPFILSVVVVASLIALFVVGGYYSVVYLLKGFDYRLNQKGIHKAGLIALLLIVYLYALLSFSRISFASIALLAGVMVFGLMSTALEKGIKEYFFLKKIPLKKLEEDDLIAFDYLPEGIQKKLELNGKRVLEESEIEKIRKLKLKIVPVYRDLPKFGPFIAIALTASLLVPGLLKLLFLFPVA
ncbi:hypothetical protein HZB89_02200 [archaeon]|nr:hypothetical protein [archaeon]